MTLIADTNRRADTASPLIEILAERWSPRAYDKSAVIDEATLTTVLEAARWAPSGSNRQPARFIVARRGSASFVKIHDALKGFNQVWADSASVLIVNVAQLPAEGERQNPWARYDLGQSVAHLSIQAQHEGLHTHQMGGFDGAAIAAAFDLTPEQDVVTVTALGVLGNADDLTAELREREVAPRTRLPLSELLLSND
ncbi:Nitroreductase [Cryobacterium flavum]|uniref:Nitroreductase n=1 Tax=Cryobacterium flavum TaxID=1424659 RepID=A0A4R8V557_9MICO|nr:MULTISPECIES: nitroreductase family protein [Cryobacterium]TFB77564.1 nitroreductase [Cryobacterium flavum]SDM49533.1 Nitroreductase [Cryobacterium flavum]